MDGLGDEVASTDAMEDVHLQNKEGEYVIKPDSCSILLSEETKPAELNSPGSSLYALGDSLEHKNAPRNSGLDDVFEYAFASQHDLDDRGDMVEELTVRSINSFSLPIVGTSSGSESTQTWQNQKQHLYHHVGGSGSRTTYCNRDNSQALEGIFENAGHRSIPLSLDKRPLNDDHSIAVEQFISRSNGVSSSTLPHGDSKSKFLSRSGFSEFFGRTTMKGEGVMRRGQTHDSLRTEPGVQNIRKSSRDSLAAPNASMDAVGGSMVASHSSPSFGTETAATSSCNDGVSLRYWLKAECHKASKSKRMHVFKQIVDLVDFSHSQGVVLHDLKPSFFKLLQLNQIRYTGRDIQKDHLDIQYVPPSRHGFDGMQAKRQKLNENPNLKRWPLFQSRPSFQMETKKDRDIAMTMPHFLQDGLHEHNLSNAAQQQSTFVNERLEDRWYESPEELNGGVRTISSNIYSLGVLLFELFCHFDSEGARAAAMLDLRHRIFPPIFLSENLKEAGFCLQLLHPEPLLRPTARDILQSEVISGFQEVLAKEISSSIEEEDAESELLHHFLVTLNEKKQKHASKLLEDIECLEADIKELEKRRRSKNSLAHFSISASESGPFDKDLSISESCTTLSRGSCADEMKIIRNIGQLENAYFSMRSKIKLHETDSTTRPDKDVLQSREILSLAQNNEEIEKPTDCFGAFFDGLYKYARYSKFEVRGLLRSGEFSNSANVICSLGFDRDEDYFAAAGVSRKIKIFEFNAFFNDAIDIHYPVIEMANKSKVSCICWNSYIKSYLASADYNGVVKLWDASTGQVVNQYNEHVNRAWSVDFSRVYPTKFASCSDDYSVKLWGINEKNSLGTIRNVANVCCVQFSAHSTHMLAFGSADCKTYCYDLRNARVPWCVLSGHDKTVSYMKFLDSETLVTASTDNTLKLWDLNKSNSSRPSCACSLTFSGHTNEKNFVGLSVADRFIACGSETNEVYSYHRSLPMPITSHKFGSIDPISGKETDDDNGLFVSSVCWRGNSDMLLAANSSGCIKVLQMV